MARYYNLSFKLFTKIEIIWCPTSPRFQNKDGSSCEE